MEADKQPLVLKKPVFITTKDLQPGSRVNMHLKVQSVNITRERKRYDGTLNRQADCVVGDEHHSVNLIARDEQLDIVKEGACITIRNANSNVFKEHMRLEVDKWAKIEITANNADKVTKVNASKNLSDVEYELVPS